MAVMFTLAGEYAELAVV